MTRLKTPLIRMLAALAIPAALIPAAQAAPLTFTVENVEARGGTLYVGVQTRDQFMEWDGIAGQQIDNPTAGTHSITFDLPEGEYSLSAWHDFDGNGRFDTLADGSPLDGWAMANSGKLRGMPTFDVVKVDLPAYGAEATESLTYPAPPRTQ
ncbi:MAG: DUF2141 domain-containing protein [Pseudomonadota bacterium]